MAGEPGSVSVSVVSKCCSELGEGPHWDERINKLIWVDILGESVHILDPETGKVRLLVGYDTRSSEGRNVFLSLVLEHRGSARGLLYIMAVYFFKYGLKVMLQSR